MQLNGKPNFGIIFSDILNGGKEMSERSKKRKNKFDNESITNFVTVENSRDKAKKDPMRKVSFLSEGKEDTKEEEGEEGGQRNDQGENENENKGESEVEIGDGNSKASSLIPFSFSPRRNRDTAHLNKGKEKLTAIEIGSPSADDREEKKREKERKEACNFINSKELMKNIKKKEAQVSLAFSRSEFVDLAGEIMRNTFHNLLLENLSGEFQIMSESIQFLSKKEQYAD